MKFSLFLAETLPIAFQICITQVEDQDAPILSSCSGIESLVLSQKLTKTEEANSTLKVSNSVASFGNPSATSNFKSAVEESAKRIIDSAGNRLKEEVQKIVSQQLGSENNIIAVVVSSVTSVLTFLAVCILFVKKNWSKVKNACGKLENFRNTSGTAEAIRLTDAEEGTNFTNPITVALVHASDSTLPDNSAVVVHQTHSDNSGIVIGEDVFKTPIGK